MNRKRESSSKIPIVAEKIRSSLVLKLNLRMVRILLSAFFAINILFSVLYFSTILWKAEIGAQDLIDRYGGSFDIIDTVEFSRENYQIRSLDEAPRGLYFGETAQEWFPLDSVKTIRGITGPSLSPGVTLSERFERVGYYMILPMEDDFYEITYPLLPDISIFFMLTIIILVFEFLYLSLILEKNRKVIRKTLKPLSDLAETAKSLQEGLNLEGSITDQNNLEHLARVISNFDTKELDKGIPVDQTQNELKDLARAINDMLNRISQSYQAQIRFVSDASHELRTPISVIQGYANLLDRWGKNDPETMEESIQAIKSETENMKALVEHLLFLARGDNENLPLQKILINICDIADEIIREARLIDSVHHFKMEYKEPIYIKVDPQLMKQAIRILVDNSMKYTPEGEEIKLKIFSKNEKVYIEVQDNGAGIKPKEVPRIFDRFYRSDQARGGKVSGAGLGLSIAKWIIEKHQGHFEVISRVDIGTRITIALPQQFEVS